MSSQFQKLAMAFFHPSLREDPFNPEDSARYFYLADQYKEALDLLVRHVLMRRGLCVIYGDVGMGKSSLLAVLRQRIHNNEMFKSYAVGEILDPSPGNDQPSDVEFSRALLSAFGQKPYGVTRSELSDQFIIFLQRQAREGKVPLLLIDEGQGLSYDALERLRIFLNYSLDDHRILQIVLFGQLELLEKVAKKRNLASRVRWTGTLEPLRNPAEVRVMIEYRLSIAGLTQGVQIFKPDAIEAIYQQSGGVPRLIVNLCSMCLDQAPRVNKRLIDLDVVEHVVPLMQKGALIDGR
jgi:type II secretory pathway predicted ATPase ExeA